MSRLTLAEEAIVIADRTEGKLELKLRIGSVHEFSPSDPSHYSLSVFAELDLPVEVNGAGEDHISEPGIPGRTMSVLMRTNARHSATLKWRFSAACLFRSHVSHSRCWPCLSEHVRVAVDAPLDS